jgi:TRAP-type C4-dicarboxylate transport system permease large subunit
VRGEGTIKDVIVGTLPFLIAMIALVAILIYFPAVATWLPNTLYDQG